MNEAERPLTDKERGLRFLLGLGGTLLSLAFFAIFLPVEWMASAHERLGLGEFPAVPIADYLARTTSALYAFHGALLLALATDVRRYRPLIRLFGWANMALGVALVAIGAHAGLPSWWVGGEGPWVAAAGALLLWLSGDGRRG